MVMDISYQFKIQWAYAGIWDIIVNCYIQWATMLHKGRSLLYLAVPVIQQAHMFTWNVDYLMFLEIRQIRLIILLINGL